ncbi:hypothetical protein D3C73_631960 [compost metagenome]
MIDILFDQYQRYNNVTNIINSLRSSGQTFNILEVGANEHQNLEKFLPLDQITYLDIQLPDSLKDNPKYILGDATAMGFSDGYYDIVVALDVFEHIAEENREKFISEIHRVSSEFFVITAPFHSSEVVEAERRVNAVYKSIFNKDFIWLEEHMVNGLPDLKKLSAYLDSRGINYTIMSHGSLEIWEKMMTIHFIAAQNSRLGIYRNEIDRFYNQYMFDNDFVDKSYRKICIGTTKRDLISLPSIETNEQLRKQHSFMLEILEERFYVLANLNISEDDNAPKDFVQIFMDEGNGYSELNSIKVELQNNRQHINIEFEPGLIKTLRIDPSNYTGTFEIKNIRLTATHGDLIYMEEFSMNGNWNLRFEDTFVFFNDDPFVILNFASQLSVKSLSFDLISLSKDEALISAIGHFDKQLAKAKLKDEANMKEIHAVRELLKEAKEKEENIEGEMQLISEQSSKRIDILESENKDLMSTINNYERSNILYQEKTEELHQKLIKIQQSNENYNNELNAIYSSKGWIYLTKLKKIFGK